jgi:hypothetical protein
MRYSYCVAFRIAAASSYSMIPVFGKDHAPTIKWSAMTIRRKVIVL